MIKISKQSQYGLRAMLYLAGKDSFCSVKEVAKNESISAVFLEKIFAKLKKAGLIKVKRGASGGYTLNKPLDKISLADIVRPLEEKVALAICLDSKSKACCPREKDCLAKNVWGRVQKAINQSLDSISLAELIN